MGTPAHCLLRKERHLHNRQNNIRNNQNFEICTTICRPGSTTTIKSKAEAGGSTLSRSIFAFLENRDNTNVDSNPIKTSMNLKNMGQGNFSNWPNASPSRQASSGTWRPHQTERGTVGEPVKSRSSTWRASHPLLCNNSASTITTSTISTTGWLGASAFLHGLSTASRAAPRRLAVPASFAFSRLTCWILV